MASIVAPSESIPFLGSVEPPLSSKRSNVALVLERNVRLIKIMFLSKKHSVWWSYMLLIGSNCIYQYLVSLVFVQISNFYIVLSSKDQPGFNALVNFCFGLFCAIAVTLAANHLFAGVFSVFARRSIVSELHDGYLTKECLYDLAYAQHDVDNPDQRITQDVSNYIDSIRTILENLVIVPGLIGYYTYTLSKVDDTNGVLIFYAFFVGSVAVCRIFMHPVIPRVYKRELAEGNFRYLHVRTRTNAESIALMQGEQCEKLMLDNSLWTVLRWQLQIVFYQTPLKFVTSYIDYIGSILAYIAIGVPIFAGKYDNLLASPDGALSAMISLNTSQALYLINQFTTITDTAETFAALYGYVSRICQLLEAIDQVKLSKNAFPPRQTFKAEGAPSTEKDPQPPVVRIEHLSLYSPAKQILINDLSFSVKLGEHLMIVGPSGCGKTTLLKTIAGLCPTGPEITDTKSSPSAHESDAPIIIHPTGESWPKIMFVPHRAYFLAGGTLFDQLSYPTIVTGSEDEYNENRVQEVLRLAGIEHLYEREKSNQLYAIDKKASETKELAQALSAGEQERVAIARILYQKPTIVFMDEPTANVPKTVEQMLFDRLFESGITVIAVTHHRDIRGFSKSLEFDADYTGNWKLSAI